jgi:hypothetical protein
MRAVQLEILEVKRNDRSAAIPDCSRPTRVRAILPPKAVLAGPYPDHEHSGCSSFQCIYTYVPYIMSYYTHTVSCPDQHWGPPSLLYNAYQVIPGGKAARAWPRPPTPI